MDISIDADLMTIPDNGVSVFVLRMDLDWVCSDPEHQQRLYDMWETVWKGAGAKKVPGLLLLSEDCELQALGDAELQEMGLVRIKDFG
jgi:hypothetical protein